MLSRKYSTCTLVREAVLENEQVIFTVWAARMTIAPLETCVAEYWTTTGFGTARVTIFAAPGVGRSAKVVAPSTGRTATQFAGSFERPVALTRWSERPLYSYAAEFRPVKSSSAPSALALIAHGKPGE